jgi:crossover junction endodeoxyribonuclease RuvC
VGITPQQFKAMQERVGGKRRAATPVFERAAISAAVATDKKILGVDPSLRGSGYGLIHAIRGNPRALAHGTISCPANWERSRCLVKISQTFRDLMKEHTPDVCVFEGLFYAQNLQTALIMGEARGAAVAAIAEFGISIYEVAPRKVKQAIVGYGAAQKSAVAKMVQRMLKLVEQPGPDAADALALALTYANETSRYSLTAPRKI